MCVLQAFTLKEGHWGQSCTLHTGDISEAYYGTERAGIMQAGRGHVDWH